MAEQMKISVWRFGLAENHRAKFKGKCLHTHESKMKHTFIVLRFKDVPS